MPDEKGTRMTTLYRLIVRGAMTRRRSRMRSPHLIFVFTFVMLGVVTVLMAQSEARYPEYQIRVVSTMTMLFPSETSQRGKVTFERVYAGRKDGSKASKTTEIVNFRPCTTTTTWGLNAHQEVTTSD